MKDLVNLQNAFMALDKDETGRILYDVKKITEKEYNNWARNFINSHYCSFNFDDEEEPIPTVLH